MGNWNKSSLLAGRWQREALTEGGIRRHLVLTLPSTMLRMVPLPASEEDL
jgi:hypothetical protein